MFPQPDDGVLPCRVSIGFEPAFAGGQPILKSGLSQRRPITVIMESDRPMCGCWLKTLHVITHTAGCILYIKQGALCKG